MDNGKYVHAAEWWKGGGGVGAYLHVHKLTHTKSGRMQIYKVTIFRFSCIQDLKSFFWDRGHLLGV